MRKLARRLFSLPQDEDLYRPLVLGAPSDSYSTMSHSGATGHPAPEPVFPDARKDDMVGTDAPVVSPQSYDEPIVTRKELWAYYCKCTVYHHHGFHAHYFYCCVPVYYNGDNVGSFSYLLLG